MPLSLPRAAGLIALSSLLISTSLADTALFAPIAMVLPKNMFKFTSYYSSGAKYWQNTSLKYGFGAGFELAASSNRYDNGKGGLSWTAQYALTRPVPDLVPGLAFGVSDIFGNGKYGPQAYVVTSFQVGLDSSLQKDPAATISLGYGMGKRSNPFVSLILPLGSDIRLFAEHDGTNINAGIELKMFQTGYVRFIDHALKPMIAVGFTQKV